MSDKNTLIALVQNLFPDNDTQDITPSKLRQALENMIGSDLNLDELTDQVVLGLVKVIAMAFNPNNPKPSHEEGLLFYDSESKAISYYNNISDTTINCGQELVLRAYNNNGATITNGQVVRDGGASINGEAVVVRSIADSVINSAAIGVATHDIAVSTIGYITYIGKVGGIDTSAFNSGDRLYVSETELGGLTNVPPSIISLVGICLVSDPVNGVIFVAPSEPGEPVALGQNFNAAPGSQPVTTTPRPIEGYTEISGLEQNVKIETPIGADGERRCLISPLASPFSGYYDFAFATTFTATTNAVIVGELYISGVPTGLTARADVSNGQIDDGMLVFPRTFTTRVIHPEDELEIYIYTLSGNSVLTFGSIMFNSKRDGIV